MSKPSSRRRTVDKEDIIRMAREAGVYTAHTELTLIAGLERFAAIVAAHEREKVAKWMVERSFATGHGDTVEDLLSELSWQAKERERWVGLTDDEIKEIIGPWGDTPIKGYTRKLFDQIENKLRDKNV